MSELIFAFGPDERYFFWDGSNPYLNNLPPSLENKLEALLGGKFDHSTFKWLCCAFGPRQSYILSTKQGASFVIYHDDLPEQLVDWLFDSKTGAHLRDVATLKVTLGSNGAFFASDKNGYRWDELPEQLEKFIQQGFKPTGSDMPRLVALGKRGCFMVVSSQGRVWMAGKPKLLETYAGIKNIGQHISFIAVDAWSEESEFCILLDNSEKPLHYIKENREDLKANAESVIQELITQKRAAAQQLSLASLSIRPKPAAQDEDWSGLDYLARAGQNNQNSFQNSRNWDAVENNNQYSGLNYLSAPTQNLTSARSLTDLRNPNAAMMMAGEQALRQQQQALYMSQRLANSQAALAAQLTINRATAAGSAAILDSIW